MAIPSAPCPYSLLALIHDRPMPANPSIRILEAFAFFENRIGQMGPDVSVLCDGLRNLRIVAVPRLILIDAEVSS